MLSFKSVLFFANLSSKKGDGYSLSLTAVSPLVSFACERDSSVNTGDTHKRKEKEERKEERQETDGGRGREGDSVTEGATDSTISHNFF